MRIKQPFQISKFKVDNFFLTKLIDTKERLRSSHVYNFFNKKKYAMIHYFSDKSMNMPLDSTGKVLLLIEKNGFNITFNIMYVVSSFNTKLFIGQLK